MTTHDEDTAVRKLYAAAGITVEEVQEIRERIGTDPETARRFITTVSNLTTVDPFVAGVFSLWLGEMLTDLIVERATTDEAFALKASTSLTDLINRLAPARPKRAPAEPTEPTRKTDVKEAPSA